MRKEKQKCEKCDRPANKSGLCGYHEVEKQWGPKWASLCHPQHPEAIKVNI